MNDEYSHFDNTTLYVVENIPGPMERSLEYETLLNNFNSQLTEHCECTEDCAYPSCDCLKRSGHTNYVKDTDNAIYKLNCRVEEKSHPMFECNSLCLCSTNCGNRIVQKGPFVGLIVKMCKDKAKGMGLFTKVSIPKRVFICEYAGELITKAQAMTRHESNKIKQKMNYIYCLNEYSDDLVLQTIVDPSDFGNIGRYINHSCEPNCSIVPIRVESPIPKLAVFTCTEIMQDEELTFDYSSFNGNSLHNQNNANVVIGNRTKCLCNSQKCMGVMPYELY